MPERVCVWRAFWKKDIGEGRLTPPLYVSGFKTNSITRHVLKDPFRNSKSEYEVESKLYKRAYLRSPSATSSDGARRVDRAVERASDLRCIGDVDINASRPDSSIELASWSSIGPHSHT